MLPRSVILRPLTKSPSEDYDPLHFLSSPVSCPCLTVYSPLSSSSVSLSIVCVPAAHSGSHLVFLIWFYMSPRTHVLSLSLSPSCSTPTLSLSLTLSFSIASMPMGSPHTDIHIYTTWFFYPVITITPSSHSYFFLLSFCIHDVPSPSCLFKHIQSCTNTHTHIHTKTRTQRSLWGDVTLEIAHKGSVSTNQRPG